MAETETGSAAHETHGAGTHADRDALVHEAVPEPLGPPDLAAWAYAFAGGAVGVVVALALYIAAT